MKKNEEKKQTSKTKHVTALVVPTLLLPFAVGEDSDPLDPNDGGADWDGDGLTNAAKENHSTDLTNPGTDTDHLPDGGGAA
jgi:hypothetical protein